MKILLITPCVDLDSRTPKGIMMPQLSLHIIAGLTPSGHEVTVIEEEVEEVDFNRDYDLVGISCMTANAPRAYEIATIFKSRGVPVVLGGVHPSILPDEAALYGDAVVVGEAEGVWEDLLHDVHAGTLKPRYQKENPSLDRYVSTKTKNSHKKRLFNILPVMTTRGCPYSCEFCCVNDLYGKKIRHFKIDNVVRDIEESDGKIFMFLDDNIIGSKKYATELFAAIKPLKIKWVGQSSVSFAKNEDLMKLARESGCGGLFFGVESVSKKQMSEMRKSFSEIDQLEDAIKRIKGTGIHFHASMCFGFDNDTTDTFEETLDFLHRNKIGTASFNVLTPYPGTALYTRLKREGRILSDHWRYYDHNTVVFRPALMTPVELQEGRLWIKKEFSKLTATLRRLPGNMSHPLMHLLMNRGAYQSAKNDLKRLPATIERLNGFEQMFNE